MSALLSIGSYLLVLGVGLPALAWRSKKLLDGGFVLPRLPFYVESGAIQLILIPFALWVAAANGIPVRFGARMDFATILTAATMLVLSLAIMWIAWTKTSPYGRVRLLDIVPHTNRERAAWIVVSCIAGVCEEILYRGVLAGVLVELGLALWSAFVVASILFGLAHLVQGWRSAFVVMGFGMLFHLLVFFSGGLALAIAVHASYDVITGLVLGSRSRTAPLEGAVSP